MKQILIQQGQVKVEEIPAPLVEDGNVLIEVAYSLISAGTESSNLEESRKPLIKKALEQPERIKKLISHLNQFGVQKTIAKVQEKVQSSIEVGYSCAGIVLQVGKGVTDIQPGDKVACGGAGMANHAEIVLVPRNLAVKVPDGCSLRDAASVTLGAIAMQGVRRAKVRLGEIVSVIGLGLLGQITAQLLKTAGCRVIGIDIDPRRLDLARQFGVDEGFLTHQVNNLTEIRNLTDDHGVDATIITAGSSSDEIVQQAMEITRKKGIVVLVGAVGLGLKRSPFYEKEIDFLISCSYGPGRYDHNYENEGLDYPYSYVRWTENRNMIEYLRLVATGKIKLDSILEREYNFIHSKAAFEELQNSNQRPLGIILRYPSNQSESLPKKLTTRVNISPKTEGGKIQVALIGSGNFAKTMHLPNLSKLAERYHLRAIVDRKGTQANDTAKQFKALYASTSYDEVLDDPEINMVLIATRHNLHSEMAIRAAQAGKAIFLEKPMALNQTELNELESVLRDTGIPFMVGFNRRFSPSAQRLKNLIKERQNPLMILYRVNAGYLPPDHWTQTDEGGGRIIGEVCHMLDLFKYLIDPSPVINISSTGIRPSTDLFQSGDNISITLSYEDGSVATLFYTGLGDLSFPKEYIEVYADGKVLVLDDFRSLRVYGSKVSGWSGIQDKGHLEELRLFADFALGYSEAPISLEDLVEITKISFSIAN